MSLDIQLVRYPPELYIYRIDSEFYIMCTGVILFCNLMYTDEGYSFSRIMYVAVTCCWSRLYVSIRKVLRPAISVQVLLGFPVSISECWDGSLYSKLLLHASHAAHQDQIKTPQIYVCYV